MDILGFWFGPSFLGLASRELTALLEGDETIPFVTRSAKSFADCLGFP